MYLLKNEIKLKSKETCALSILTVVYKSIRIFCWYIYFFKVLLHVYKERKGLPFRRRSLMQIGLIQPTAIKNTLGLCIICHLFFFFFNQYLIFIENRLDKRQKSAFQLHMHAVMLGPLLIILLVIFQRVWSFVASQKTLLRF